MADIVDISSEYSEMLMELALKQHFKRVTTSKTKNCIDCDEPINSKRLSMNIGCVRCVDCQEHFEKRQKHF